MLNVVLLPNSCLIKNWGSWNTSQRTPRGWTSGRQRTAAVAVAADVDLSVKLRH
jgi:hypothetical protein